MTFVSSVILPGEPIQICTFAGVFSANDVAKAYRIPFWREEFRITGAHVISDVRQVSEESFAETMKALGVALQYDAQHADIMSHFHWYMVGPKSAFIKLYANARSLPQLGGVGMSLYDNMEDALLSARAYIKLLREKHE